MQGNNFRRKNPPNFKIKHYEIHMYTLSSYLCIFHYYFDLFVNLYAINIRAYT